MSFLIQIKGVECWFYDAMSYDNRKVYIRKEKGYIGSPFLCISFMSDDFDALFCAEFQTQLL